MDKLKKVGLVALALAALAVAPVHAAESGNQSPAQAGQWGGIHQNLDFMGMKVKRLVATGTAKLLVSGEGLLYGVCAFGGTVQKYSMAFDTTASAQLEAVGLGGTTDHNANYEYALSPKVFTTPTYDTTSENRGCWFPPNPVKFTTGLYGDQDDSGHSTVFYVGCSDGDNPCGI